jgi:hypothetical protein
MFYLGLELDPKLMKKGWSKRCATRSRALRPQGLSRCSRPCSHSLPIAAAAIIVPFSIGAAASDWCRIERQPASAALLTPRSLRAGWTVSTERSLTAASRTVRPSSCSAARHSHLPLSPCSRPFSPPHASALRPSAFRHAPCGSRVLCLPRVQALSCAAIDDLMAWCVLAIATSFATSKSPTNGLITTAFAVVYVTIMLVVVKPIVKRLYLLMRAPVCAAVRNVGALDGL